MTRSRPTTVHLAACAVTALVMSFGAMAGCSSDDTTTASTTTVDTRGAYCEAWSGLITAFGRYDEIDVVNGGLDSVRSYLDELDAATQQLAESSSAQLQPSVAAFEAALDNLGTTLTSSSLPVDRRDQVRAAAAEVDAAWNQMVDAFRADCPSVTATTVEPTGA